MSAWNTPEELTRPGESTALLALQTAAAAFLIELLADAYLRSCLTKQASLLPKDIQLTRRHRGLPDDLG
ncbi:hypothetical protein E2320_019738 [Naja naja]|nr:hypothetical protein E2320_019738 [Naja naja]